MSEGIYDIAQLGRYELLQTVFIIRHLELEFFDMPEDYYNSIVVLTEFLDYINKDEYYKKSNAIGKLLCQRAEYKKMLKIPLMQTHEIKRNAKNTFDLYKRDGELLKYLYDNLKLKGKRILVFPRINGTNEFLQSELQNNTIVTGRAKKQYEIKEYEDVQWLQKNNLNISYI